MRPRHFLPATLLSLALTVPGLTQATTASAVATGESTTLSTTTAEAKKKVTLRKQSTKSRWAGQQLGTYKGPHDQAWQALTRTGVKAKNKPYVQQLVNIPKVGWMGAWQADDVVYESTKNYIRDTQQGDPTKIVAIASFRLDPWYTEARTANPSAANIASYKRWIRNQVRAIGNTPTIIVLQPDMPFLMTAKHKKKYQGMLKFAAAEYNKNANTKIYLEAGSWDWPAPGQGGAKAAAKFLEPIGIKNVDGFALGSTHYTSLEKEILRSKELVDIFRKKGYKNELRTVITTASNGNPWNFGDWQFKHRGVADEAPACTSKKQFKKVTCVTTGVPPTFDVANPKWGLSKTARARAKKYVDAYLWFSRPWLDMQNSPFLEDKTATMLKVSPFRKYYAQYK
ncbi:glycoside hydrolase family 6 protein [Nocardioides yefusunii]|uniref:Glycoside hydrolase family 6 protein n=1 Tax=Nocardioides yefusunii TaxID=2500546 RepID=A0ABW1QX36_9ACTN|nr:glycoside hydrolase family 6 protein [Nocardioides yefusunii]